MKFQIAVKYKNYSFEEILEIDADSVEKAKTKCEEIKQENHELIEKLSGKNIYSSKIIEDCRLYKVDKEEKIEKPKIHWRDELIAKLDAIMPKNNLENNI